MLEFYGLREHPFGVSPDPRFLYPSAQHREAMASLAFGIENKVGIAALIAEPGAGKTTLLFDVLQRYQHRASTAFVFNTQCGSAELLRQIVVELAISGGEEERDPIRLHQIFTSFVARQVHSKPVVIIIDEAQNLENSALETVRLLSNFEAADRKLLHIILAGQPQLADKLRHPSLTQLLQRITMVSRLARFTRDQMEECIAFRLQVAGFDGKALFSGRAMDKIMDASGGVPRELNRICINAMQLGFATRQRLIGEDAVDEVISDLTLAKWIPEAELPLSGMQSGQSLPMRAAFRVGASMASSAPQGVESRPGVPPRESIATPAAEQREGWDRASLSSPAPRREPSHPAAQIPPRTQEATQAPEAASAVPAPPSREDSRNSRSLDRNTRRALLEAAAQRRRAAELRLIGMRYREGSTPAQIHAIYPYKFAMGCVPDASAGETEYRSGTLDDEPGTASRADEPQVNQQDNQDNQEDNRNRKTGT